MKALSAANDENADERQRWRDRHRRREEAVLRSFDATAAAEYRIKRAQQRREEREHAAAISSVVEDLIARLEREAGRKMRRWRCPAGCAPGDASCARLAFRMQCVPSHRRNCVFVAKHTVRTVHYGARSGRPCNLLRRGDFVEPLSESYEITTGEYATPEQWREARSVTTEMREDFLLTWNGITFPEVSDFANQLWVPCAYAHHPWSLVTVW